MIWHNKIGWKKLKHVDLDQKNGFGSTQLPNLWWLIKGASTLCTCVKEYNEYDLTDD